jgi:CheY-like chemotaxis protein
MQELRALIVDDVQSMRKFLKFGMEKTFPKVFIDEACNGKEAQLKLESGKYDLVLCDWEMPLLNGEELLCWMREQPSLKKTPFIMVTSRDDKSSVVRAMEQGVDSYVIKPFTADGLAQKVMSLISRADRRETERIEVQGSTRLRFGENVAQGNIIDVSLGGIFNTFSRANPLPGIFGEVKLDISLNESLKIEGLKGFVVRIQAAEAFIDAEHVKIAVKFEDLSAERKEKFEKILNLVKAG